MRDRGGGPAQLIAIPRSLGRLGVLAEPASACARGIRHARTIGGRQPWELQKALVVGAGAIGMLSTYLLRLAGLEVWTTSRESSSDDRSALVALSGARYVSTRETPLRALGEDVGGFDLVVEATGDAQIMADCIGLLRRNGVACLLGIDSRLQDRRARRTRGRCRLDSREPRSLRQRERTAPGLARRSRGARPRARAVAGRARSIRRPTRTARPLRRGVRLPGREGDARAGRD